MTAKELKEALANVPDDAEMYINAYTSGKENVKEGYFNKEYLKQ